MISIKASEPPCRAARLAFEYFLQDYLYSAMIPGTWSGVRRP